MVQLWNIKPYSAELKEPKKPSRGEAFGQRIYRSKPIIYNPNASPSLMVFAKPGCSRCLFAEMTILVKKPG
jgi:hypothetical protein